MSIRQNPNPQGLILTTKVPLILASASPRRRELLAKICSDFKIITAEVTELTECFDLKKLPEYNAEIKAKAVAQLYPMSLVIGADTVIYFNGKTMGKPRDYQEAEFFLAQLSANTHEVISGVTLIHSDSNFTLSWSETTQVTFKNLTAEIIREYLQKVDVLDKAGAYAIQEHGDLIISSISGELSNVIGLPMSRLKKELALFS